MYKCFTCKFCDIDYAFDEDIGEEYPICSCEKGNDTESEEECADYEKYIARKSKEPSYECDGCKYLFECDNTIECTESWNIRRHYEKGRGFCKKDNEVQDV